MKLENVDLDKLQIAVQGGQELPSQLQRYLDLMELVRGLYNKYEKRTFIMNLLTNAPYNIPATTAQRIYTDALNFFYADNGVKKEAWKHIYASRFEQAAEVAWNEGDMETFAKCIRNAAECRGIFKEDPPSLPDGINDEKVIVYTINSEQLGLPKTDRKKLAKFIDDLNITDMDKKRLKSDAMTEDTAFNIIPDE